MNDDVNDPVVAAHGASTLLEVLDDLRGRGYGEQMIAERDGTLRCGGCGARPAAGDVHVDGFRRLEGASDPADMNIVVWLRCPECARGGAATIGFGPNASEADQAVLELIDLDDTAG